MRTSKAWHGVRLRWVEAAADPDARASRIQLPASWSDGAAAAIAGMAPGARTVALPELAEGWIAPAALRADEAGLFTKASFAAALHDMLIRRRAVPGQAIWEKPTAFGQETPRFVFNLPAFLDPGAGFDCDGFRDAVDIATVALTVLRPDARRLALGFADLDGLLAGLGLDYDSQAARDVAASLAALLRGRAECTSARLSGITGRSFCPDSWTSPPGHHGLVHTRLADLAAAGREACAEAAALPRCAHESVAALSGSDAAEALLGVETTGLAPAFARTGPDGTLTRATRHLLAARDLSPETALAAMFRGELILGVPSQQAHAAMHAVVGAILPVPPLRRIAEAARPDAGQAERVSPPVAVAVDLPTRRSGTMQKASVGSHRLYLRTAEYADGKLGEIGITLQKEAPAFRALMDAFATAVSLGLQHGVPLEPFVEAFVGTRFGTGGAVEGDTAVGSATSIIDYVFRHLAAAHLGRTIPDPEESGVAYGPLAAEPAPTLPLDLPREAPEARRRGLRLVS
jgi:ribonucleoside-diphosphate reductase alpha chain